MKQLFDYISKRIDLNEDIKKFIKSVSTVKKIKKGVVLIEENQNVNKTYFVIDGCLRSYVFDSHAII